MDEPTPHQEPQHTFASEVFEFIWETAKVVIVSLIIILPVRYFLVQPFFVKGSSMVPNFHDREYILVDKWTYGFSGSPQRGDVIVFKYPDDPSEYFIKRIIGLPGESLLVSDSTVKVFNGQYPDGFVLDESIYLPAENHTVCANAGTYCGRKITLGPDQYFVMGDNREHSSDSRFFGPVNRTQFFSGMAWLRLWPLDRIGFIPRTSYVYPSLSPMPVNQ